MEAKEEQPKVDEQAQKEQVQPNIDIYEQMKKLKEEEKKICQGKLNEFSSSLYLNGLIYKLKDTGVKHIPISLYPSPIPSSLFDKISFYQIAFNKILSKLSNDQKYLEEILTPIVSHDKFIEKLLEISKKSHNFDKKQKIKLAFVRNDYLLDKEQKFLFLQNYKTHNANFGIYTDNMLTFYEYYKEKYPEVFAKYKGKEVNIPNNKGNAKEYFSNALYEGIKLAFPNDYHKTKILIIANKDDKFDFDLQPILNELYDYIEDPKEKKEKLKLKYIKLPLNEVCTKLKKDEQGNLTYDNTKISLIYFKSGDKPEDYPDEESWQGREFLELSTAIKVPDVNTFLTSLKVFQYYLSKPSIIMHYYNTEFVINDILRFFGGIYYVPDMDKEKQTELFNKIRNEPNKYIFKNLYGNKNYLTGENLKSKIPEEGGEPSDQIKNGIILECCTPPEHETLLIKNEEAKIENVISEYSIYGIILMNDNNYIITKSLSYLVRSATKDNINDFETFLEDDNNIAIDLPCVVDIKIEPNLIHKVEVKAEDIQKYQDELKAAEEEEKRKKEKKKKKKKEEEEKLKAEEEAKKKADEEEAKKKEEDEKGKANEEPPK